MSKQKFLKILAEQEDEVRRAIMSLTYWNGGIRKQHLRNILSYQGHNPVLAKRNILVLEKTGVLNIVNDLILPAKHCEAIAFTRVEDVDLLFSFFDKKQGASNG